MAKYGVEAMRRIQHQVLTNLRPVEIQYEYLIREFASTTGAAQKHRIDDIKLIEEIFIQIGSTEKAAVSLQRMIYGGAAPSTLLSQYFAAVVAIQAQMAGVGAAAIASLTAQQRMILSAARLVNGLATLGTFYSGKFGLGVLSASPIVLSIVPDKEDLARIEAGLNSVSSEDGVAQNLMTPVANDIRADAGEALARLVRYHMQRTPIAPIGGSYPATPITNTGELAAAVIPLPGHQLRRFSRGKQARAYAHAVSVGVSGGRPELYGTVLAKAFPSKPPITSAPDGFFGRDAQARFMEWGQWRGHSKPVIRRIMATVWRRGTYGRAWMAQIARRISGNEVAQFIITSFRYRINQIFGGK